MDKVKLILDTSRIYDLIGFGEKSITKPYINYDEIRKEPLFIPIYAVLEFWTISHPIIIFAFAV